MVPLIGLIFGLLIGILIPSRIPSEYSNYAAVAILAALDSIFGGISAQLEGKFNLKIFVTGFFGNAILATLLAIVGDKLGIQLYLAAVFVFGNRMFMNFAKIRRHWLKIE